MDVSPSNLLIAFTIFYFVVCLGLFIFQRKIIYLPSGKIGTPTEYGFSKVKELNLKTSDGETINAWHLFPQEEGGETILYFHGNAGHMGDRSEKFRAFLNHGFNVLSVSYRGYGNSGGKPSEEGLYNDARAAAKYLLDNDISFSNIIIFGESLGSGVAVQLATEYKAKAIVLEAPYISVTQRASELYPVIPVKLLLKDRFESIKKIKNVKSPLLILHGELDKVIPIKQGRQLLEAANEPKKGIFYPNIGHTDFDSELLAKEVRAFSDKYL